MLWRVQHLPQRISMKCATRRSRRETQSSASPPVRCRRQSSSSLLVAGLSNRAMPSGYTGTSLAGSAHLMRNSVPFALRLSLPSKQRASTALSSSHRTWRLPGLHVIRLYIPVRVTLWWYAGAFQSGLPSLLAIPLTLSTSQRETAGPPMWV